MVRAMANLRDQFAAYYAPDEEAIAAALRTGLVTPDTNVMLAAYRFEVQARDELLSAFEKLDDRLWIPHQVALEFHRNRLSVIAAQEAFFGATQAELDKAVGTYLEKLKAFANRIAMPQPRAQKLEQMIREVHAQVKNHVTKAEEANEVHLDQRDSDGVLARFEALFDGRVGEPMPPDALAEARKEARRRVDSKTPPGFADKDKADPSGDYLVWKQLLDEAAVRRVPVVLVTDDRKEDWVRREHGLTIGARPELCEEMSAASGAPFLLMSTAAFLRHAKEYLSATVSPQTVEQARELPDVQAGQSHPVVEEMYSQARDQIARATELRLKAELDVVAARAHEQEALRRKAERQATAGTWRLHADLEASRASRIAAEEKLDMLKRETERLSDLLEVLDRERARPQPSVSAVEIDWTDGIRLAQPRGDGGQPLGPGAAHRTWRPASFCRIRAQVGRLAEDSADHDQVELPHGKEKVNRSIPLGGSRSEAKIRTPRKSRAIPGVKMPPRVAHQLVCDPGRCLTPWFWFPGDSLRTRFR
jgi:PIN like domain